MHRLKSTPTIYRFRFAAILLCFKFLLIPVTLGILIFALATSNHSLALIGVNLIALEVLITIVQWVLALRTGCPLCVVPVLARKKCMPHRHARTLLGSHRLRVALAIVFRNSFTCPYCHEPTVLEVRERNRRP